MTITERDQLRKGELPVGHRLIRRFRWRMRNPRGLRWPRKVKR